MDGSTKGAAWFGPQLLGPLAEVNVHCLELMRQRVREGESEGGSRQALPRALAELAPLWSGLSDEAIGRIAGFPYALVETCFADIVHWRAGRVRDAVDAALAEPCSGIDREAATGLAREAVLLAWHLARSHRQAARMLFGMDARCIELVSGCSLRELQRLTDARAVGVRLRWSDRPAIWRHALAAASAADEPALTRAKLRGLQLLAAEARGVPAQPRPQGQSCAEP